MPLWYMGALLAYETLDRLCSFSLVSSDSSLMFDVPFSLVDSFSLRRSLSCPVLDDDERCLSRSFSRCFDELLLEWCFDDELELLCPLSLSLVDDDDDDFGLSLSFSLSLSCLELLLLCSFLRSLSRSERFLSWDDDDFFSVSPTALVDGCFSLSWVRSRSRSLSLFDDLWELLVCFSLSRCLSLLLPVFDDECLLLNSIFQKY